MTIHAHTLDPQQYSDLLAERCPVTVPTWKKLKSILYAFLFATVGYGAWNYNADPTITMSMTITAMLIVYGIEVKELEIASVLTLTFKNGGNERERDD